MAGSSAMTTSLAGLIERHYRVIKNEIAAWERILSTCALDTPERDRVSHGIYALKEVRAALRRSDRMARKATNDR